jgi:hypothetical protein
MNNQGVIGRATFGLKNFGHGHFLAGVCSQAIHSLGGQSQEFASTQSLGGLLHVRGGVARNDHEIGKL